MASPGSDAASLAEEAEAAELAAGKDPRNVQNMLRIADLCLHAGDGARAKGLVRRAAGLAPNDHRVLRSASGILAAEGVRDEAIDLGLRAVALAPGDPELRLHVGGLLVSDRQWHAAMQHLLLHLGSPAPTASGWRQLSSALQESGRTDRAIEAIDRALSMDGAQAEYRIHRASLLASKGRYGDAVDELDRAAQAAADDARIWRMRSGIHEVLQEPVQAMLDAEKAVALDPGSAEYAQHYEHVRALIGIEPSPPQPGEALEYWAPRLRRNAPMQGGKPAASLPTLIRTQGRIVFAVILREMRTRFGHTRLGYVWAIVEPISHLLTLGSVFSLLNHSPPPVGDSLFLFYLTGLLPFLMFGHVSQELMNVLSANAPVLQLPAVKRIDVILARSLLHLATEVLVGILVGTWFAALGHQGLPADILTVGQAVLCLWLIAIGIGVVNMVIGHLFPTWETMYGAISRLLYFASGIYYSPIAMPDRVRDVLMYNPILQCVEWFRAGFYRQYQPHWLDRGYALTWALGALVIGLAMERALRRRLAVVA